MAQEVERKFLVTNDGWRDDVAASLRIEQAYLALRDEAEVRVRITDGRKAELTIKGGAAARSRSEFEYEIPLDDARAMVELRQGLCIRKTRHIVPRPEGRHWEIDVFEGELAGLCLAEVERDEGRENPLVLDRPAWLGKEVTGNARYYNASLAANGLP